MCPLFGAPQCMCASRSELRFCTKFTKQYLWFYNMNNYMYETFILFSLLVGKYILCMCVLNSLKTIEDSKPNS